MSDDLIQVILDDRSASVSTSVGATGATVIKAARGGDTPILFQPKQKKRILNMLGYPGAGNEAIDDIITYNNMVNDRYKDILHCVEKVLLSYPNIEYHYEIMSTENEKISKFVYIPYMQYVEIIFKV